MIRKRSIIFLQIVFVIGFIIFLYFKTKVKRDYTDYNPLFEVQVAKALGLTHINTSLMYNNSYTRIFNDTIVGYSNHTDSSSKYKYFIQSLQNLKEKKFFMSEDLKSIPVSIDYLKHGCLYFGKFGGSVMQSLCSDGTLKDFFSAYTNEMFYVNKVMLYKDKTIIISMNGIYIFNTQSQKLLYNYKFKNDIDLSSGSVVNNKFIFDEEFTKNKPDEFYSFIHCIDLNKLVVVWKRKFDRKMVGGGGRNEIYQEPMNLKFSKTDVLLNSINKLYFLDLKDGRTNFVSDKYGKFVIDTNYYFLSKENTIYGVNIIDKKTVWNVENAKLIGVYKSFLVCKRPDNKSYLIIKKGTGKILTEILSSNNKQMDLTIIDKYVFIKHTSLYK